jgi:flagellar protein FlaF
MSLEAYKQAQRAAESPRETEYRLFAQVTRALIDADKSRLYDHAFVDAVDWNRRMWSTFSTDCGLPGNGLPDQLRAQIISIALWVSRYSSDVIQKKAPMDALIDVNRAIMDGLAAQPQNMAAG